MTRRKQAPAPVRTAVDPEKLERITEMLELARSIVKELETGETVETDADADAAIDEATDYTSQLAALLRVAKTGDE